jgi:hypothetical protein
MAETAAQQLIDLWKKQVEEGTQAWLRLFAPPGAGAPAWDAQAFWKPFMDQGVAAWSRVMTQGSPSPDLMAQWKQFLDQWINAWARVLEQAMGTEAFARAMGQQLEGFLGASGPVKKAVEQQQEAAAAALGLASRAQLTGVARQIAQLEEKIDALDDALGRLARRLEER